MIASLSWRDNRRTASVVSSSLWSSRIHACAACPGPNHCFLFSRMSAAVKPMLSCSSSRVPISFSRRLYMRMSSSSKALPRDILPAIIKSYSAWVTIGSRHFLGSMTDNSDAWKNGPASLMYIHRAWFLHLHVAVLQSHRLGRSLRRLYPSTSNCHPQNSTG